MQSDGQEYEGAVGQQIQWTKELVDAILACASQDSVVEADSDAKRTALAKQVLAAWGADANKTYRKEIATMTDNRLATKLRDLRDLLVARRTCCNTKPAFWRLAFADPDGDPGWVVKKEAFQITDSVIEEAKKWFPADWEERLEKLRKPLST